ncbi:nuclear transport factor 2 family protein [Streptomyces sp. NPDC057806]|uniref:nuclear transport factor 2 family protein n=1 Tax=Streptomyces sp. NPDC057806 TaxID=3346255 RepID=UPI00367EF4C6
MTTARTGTAPGGTNSLDSAADVALVTQVVLAERQGRDRGWWDLMADRYWPDSAVRLSWYDGNGAGFVAGSRAMAERGSVALHHMYAPVVHVRGARAYAEASTGLRFQVEVDGVRGELLSHTRLNYRLERRDQVWKILSLDAVYEYCTLTPSVPGQQIVVPVEELAAYRPSYALLAWNIARDGRTPGSEELGDDRPEELAAFYASVWEWLDAGPT